MTRYSRPTLVVIALSVALVVAATGLAITGAGYVSARGRGTERLLVVDQLLLAARLDELATSSLHLVPELADPEDSIDEIVEDIDDETALVMEVLAELDIAARIEVAITDAVIDLAGVVETGNTAVGVDVATSWSFTSGARRRRIWLAPRTRGQMQRWPTRGRSSPATSISCPTSSSVFPSILFSFGRATNASRLGSRPWRLRTIRICSIRRWTSSGLPTPGPGSRTLTI